MIALSIRQPWAWLIVNGHKDIENRTWPTRYRGSVLIHAGKGMTTEEYDDVEEFIRFGNFDIRLPAVGALERGGIVGAAEIVGCIQSSASPWFFGPHGFLMRNARPLRFKPWRGQLGFFDVNDAEPS